MISTEERFSLALKNTSHCLQQALAANLRPIGVSVAGWTAIAEVVRAEAPLSQTALADLLGLKAATVVKTIDRLVSAGIVARTPSGGDRRVNLVAPTQYGRDLYARLNLQTSAFLSTILAPIDQDALRETIETLTILQQRLASITPWIKDNAFLRGHCISSSQRRPMDTCQ